MVPRRQFLSRAAAASFCLGGQALSWSAPAPRRPDNEVSSKLITPEAREAIEAGLAYLAARQLPDGSFGTTAYRGNVAVTSLSALAFMAAGHLPDTRDRGKVVDGALSFVLSQENRDGNHPGYLFNPDASPHGPMYNHAFATLFLVHRHGRLKDRQRDNKLGEVLGRALRLIVSAQNGTGGWRYTPESRDADLSVTGCQMTALIAARAAGHDVPRETIRAGVEYVKKCQDRATGAFRYMDLPAGALGPVGPQSFARTAIGAAVLQAAEGIKGPEIDKALSFLARTRPRFLPPDIHFFYGYYYAALAFRIRGGKTWEEWYATVRKELLDHRRKDGCWLDQICQHYGTAMACLTLLSPDAQVPLRSGQK